VTRRRNVASGVADVRASFPEKNIDQALKPWYTNVVHSLRWSLQKDLIFQAF
jgi:hypothetical protein